MKVHFAPPLAAAALSLSAMTAPALAGQTPEDAVINKISYGDLDLSTTQGMETLKMRFNRAAREVCGMDVAYRGSQLATSEARDCYAATQSRFEVRLAALAEQSKRGG